MNADMTKDTNHFCGKYVSWRAAFAGAVVALGLTFLFNFLTIAVGLSTFVTTEKGLETIAFVGFSWMFVGSFIILFIAGWVAGRAICHAHAQNLHACKGMLHGFLAWSLYLIISILLISHLASSPTLFKNAFINVTMTDNVNKMLNGPTHSQQTPAASQQSASEGMSESDRAATEQVAHKLGLATLATFFIFAIGTLGCMIGAACGIDKSRRCAMKDQNINR